MIRLKQLLKEETFTATNKQSGKTSVFKSKDSRDAAIKAGTHDAMKDKKQPSAPKVAGSDMFGGDYAKDRGGESSKVDTKSIIKGLLKKADKEFGGAYKLADVVDNFKDSVDISDSDGKELKARLDKGENGTYVQTAETEGTIVFNDGSQYQFSHVEDGPIPVTKVGGDAPKAEPNTKEEPKKINNPTEALPKEIYAKMDNEDSDAGEMDYLSSTDGSIKYGIAKEGDKYYVTLGTEEGEILKSFGKTKNAEEAAQIFMKNLDAVKSKYNLDVDSNKDNTDWMDNLDSIDISDIKGKADPNADSFTNDDVFGATFKDPKTNKTITVRDAYEREDNSPAYKKAFAYVSQFDPDGEAVMGTDAYNNTKKEGIIRLTKIMEAGPCWNGYKQVGMKDKNGREVPNCVPEGVVKEAGIPKLFLKIEAVKKKIKELMDARKVAVVPYNKEVDPRKKEALKQPLIKLTAQIKSYQKNLLNLLDMEEKYIQTLNQNDELELS